MTERESQKGPKRSERRRHGRFRRWVVRPVFWLLAAAAVLALAGVRLLESGFVQERGRRWLETRLESYLDREVRIEGLRLEALPLTLELRGVEIAGSSDAEPPFVEVGRVLAEARSLSWNRRSLSLGRILIEEPLVRLVFRPDGTSNLPLRGRRAGAGAGAPFELRVREFTIRGGAVEVEQQRLPLSVAGRGLRANLLGGGGLEATGRVDVQDVELLLPRARPYLGALSLRVVAGVDGLRISSGRVSGPQLDAELGGEWLWRGDKRLDLEIDATADATLFDQLGYTSGQLRGRFRFAGGLAWRPELWGYRGTLTAPELSVFGRDLSELVAELAGDRNGIRADVSEAAYGGGRVGGQVAYRFQEEGRPFDLELELDQVRLARLLADQGIPLTGVDARVSGPFDYSFPSREPQRGSGRAQLALRAGPPSDAALELSGAAPLSFDDGVLRSDAIRVVSESQHALIAIDYDIAARTGRVELDVGTERIAELLRLLPLPPGDLESAAWAPTRGSGRVGGSLFLTPAGFGSQVRFDLDDVEAPGAHAERAFGAFSVDATGIGDLRVELLRADGAVIVNGSIPFATAEGPASDVPFAISVDAAGWPSADAEAWFDLGLPVAGTIGGSLALGGEASELSGRLEATLAPARIAELEVDSLAVELDFDPRELRFARLEAATPAGGVRLRGELARPTGSLRLELDSDALDLSRAPLDRLLPGASGRVELTAAVGGELEQPRVDGELVWTGTALRGAALEGIARTSISWVGERLEIAGSLPAVPIIEGAGRLDRQGFEVEIELAIEELAAVLTALDYPPARELSGSLAGTLSASASFDGDAPMAVGLELDRLRLSRGALSLSAAEPVVLRLRGSELEVESLFLTTPAGEDELFVAGRVALGAEPALDLTAQSSLGSAWLDLLLPQLGLRGGRFDVLASIGGTMAQPLLNGVGRLEGASTLITAASTSIEDLEGLVLFYPDRIVLDSVRAAAGGGTLEAGGSVMLARGAAAASYRVDVVGRGLSLAYPEGWQLRGDARASLVSTDAGRALRGEVELDRAYYATPVKLGFESALQALFQRRRLEVRETSELMATTALDLRIHGREALRVRNNLARVSGDVDFTLRGTLADPVLFGSVELRPGGTLVYAGNEYEIERGELDFANPYKIEPIVDLLATTDLREYDVRLNLTGSPERLEVGVSSNPPLPELEVLALLTGGRAPAALGLAGGNGTADGLGVEGFLAGEAASVVTERVNRLFGLDRLRVSPLTGSSGDLSSARVTLGERISRDLFATYSYDPSTTEEQILELEWSVSPTLVVVLTQNGDASYSVDLRWEKAF